MADNTENEWVASNRILVFARDENAAKKRWSLSKMAFFSEVEKTYRHTFLSSNYQYLPRGDSWNLCA